jgi:ParB family protein of integrating conjugative element (PFGI_1 class)
MPDPTLQEMAGKLLMENFTRSGPAAQALSDPLCDTPIMVTLDELRPYELNPRIMRNPLFDDIKASIQERGLDAPPPITRRPEADHYIIRNGGNTRLSILRELWSETKEERFFRISCLFRPWPERGEIVALTGHLAENELHGGLSFIERALGVEKARDLYEQENGQPLTQRELARCLAADGYPIQQSHISRMGDTIRYLLPAIPNVLYGGLGRPQIERLIVLRRAGEIVWNQYAQGKSLPMDFEMLFQEVLSSFDLAPGEFSVPHAQDKLIGQMAKYLEIRYHHLELEIEAIEDRQDTLMISHRQAIEAGIVIPPALPPALSRQDVSSLPLARNADGDLPSSPPLKGKPATESPVQSPPQAGLPAEAGAEANVPVWEETPSREHGVSPVVSPAAGTERLQAIRQLVAEHAGESQSAPDAPEDAPHTLPIQVGGLFPITDVWRIEPGLDTPERLRIQTAQFAREIAGEAGLSEYVAPTDDGIGFVCAPPPPDELPSPLARALSSLLGLLCGETDLASLLRGRRFPIPVFASGAARLSDAGFIKLFRLPRLSRRLLDIEAGPDGAGH